MYVSNPNATTIQILSKRLTLYDYLKDREILFDVRSNALALEPRVTWREIDAIFEPGSQAYPWFVTKDRASPWFGHATDVDHFFPTNGKMIAPTWSISPGPAQFGGTCLVADAMFHLTDVPYLSDGRIVHARITPNQAQHKLDLIGQDGDPEDWICNDCYALKGQYFFVSKIIKWIAVRLWMERAGMSNFAVSFIDMIRYNQSRLLRVLDRKGMGPKKLAKSSVAHPNYFRIHDAGDFFSPAYYAAWCEIAAACPDIHFWAATRAWAIPSLAKQFAAIPRPKNLIVRPSELFKGEPPRKHDWPKAAATGVGWSRKKVEKGQKPDTQARGAIECPVARSPQKTCQTSGGLVEYNGRLPRGCAWPSGCRACWDSPQTPIIYREH